MKKILLAITILILAGRNKPAAVQTVVLKDTTFLLPEILPEIHRQKGEKIQDVSNNPGNITAGVERYDTLAIGYVSSRNRKLKFLVFPDTMTGFKALEMRIRASETQTFKQFFKRYVGSSINYCTFVCRKIGARPTDRVSDHLDKIQTIKQLISIKEGWKNKQKKYKYRRMSSILYKNSKRITTRTL